MGFLIFAILGIMMLCMRFMIFCAKLMIAIIILAVTCLTGKPRWFWIY